MKILKIIELTFVPNNSNELERSKGTDYYYLFGWSSVFARRLKRVYPHLDIENWRADLGIGRTIEKEVLGVKCRVFPYKTPIVKNALTLEMIRVINKLSKKYNVILHFHSLYNTYYNLLVPYLFPRIKLVLSHHGGQPPDGLTKNILYNHSLKKYNALTYLNLITLNFLRGIKNHPPIYFLPVGADFDFFKPVSKKSAREYLNLDPNKIYGIYVGSFYKLKGVDKILEVYRALKEKYNFEIILVGGNNDDYNDLYDEVVKSGCIYYHYQPREKLIYLYSASDFYIHPAFHKDFGGIDIAWMEALACNRPVLTTHFLDVEFNHEELGINLEKENNLVDEVERMIKTHEKYTKCRDHAIKYLDGNSSIINKLYNIYTHVTNEC